MKEKFTPSVNLGDATYPPHIIEMIKVTGNIVKVVHAQRVALTAGDMRTENTALLGALSSYLKRLDISLWEKVIKESFPKKAIEVNLKAFHMGRTA
jgi:indolepyruvate ferredoxin oxidoreductase beta subunit